jgi:hypothetical protein
VKVVKLADLLKAKKNGSGGEKEASPVNEVSESEEASDSAVNPAGEMHD